MAAAAYFHDHSLDAVLHLERFARNLLGARQQRFGLVHRDDRGACIHTLNRAGDQLALETLEILKDGVRLGFANLLDDQVLGRLGGNAAKGLGVNQFAIAFGFNRAGHAVDRHGDRYWFHVLPAGTFHRDLEGLFDPGEDNFLGDLLLLVHLVDDLQHVGSLDRHEFTLPKSQVPSRLQLVPSNQ